MTKTNEAFWWSLFSAGGVMSALCLPALIVATGLILPFTASESTGIAVNGAHNTTSGSPSPAPTSAATALASCTDSRRVRCIFQFPAMSGLRWEVMAKMSTALYNKY